MRHLQGLKEREDSLKGFTLQVTLILRKDSSCISQMKKLSEVLDLAMEVMPYSERNVMH